MNTTQRNDDCVDKISKPDSVLKWNCNTEDNSKVYLTEKFYISSKKNSVFQVKLTDCGLCLRKETNSSVKEQIIKITDIIGCRCLRSQKKSKRRGRAACACSSSMPNDKNRVVEDDNLELDESDASAYLYVYAYVFKKSLRSCRRERTVLTLRFRSFDKFEDNNREAQKWRCAIKRLMSSDSTTFIPNKMSILTSSVPEQRRLLVILNPKSGSGKAREFFQQQVAPIYAEAEIGYDLHVTKRANFARELVRHKSDIFSYRGIVVCGGDGIYYEVINGLMERQDWEEVFQNIPLGIIPCGSGNGLARSIAHIFNEPYEPKPILNAAITTANGSTNWMDLVRIETKSQIMFSFLSIGWGIISDIDIESERLRYMGGQRFTLWSVRRLISLRTYHGKISYKLADTRLIEDAEESTELKPAIKHSISYNTYLSDNANDEHYTSVESELHKMNEGSSSGLGDGSDFGEVISLETSGKADNFRPRHDSFYSVTSRKSAYYSLAESEYRSINGESEAGESDDVPESKKNVQIFGPSSTMPSLMSTVPDDWTTEEGDYVMVHAAYQTHLGSDVFFAPSSKLNDGIIWLVVIRAGATRSQLLNFMLGLSSGTHLPEKEHEFIKILPVTAFRIVPTGTDGILAVDGERVDYGPIQAEVCPELARVMVPINQKTQ